MQCDADAVSLEQRWWFKKIFEFLLHCNLFLCIFYWVFLFDYLPRHKKKGNLTLVYYISLLIPIIKLCIIQYHCYQ